MNPSLLETLPARIVECLDPIRVQEYLRATGWQIESRLGKGKVAVYERPESRLEQMSVPLNHDVADFSEIMSTAMSAIARFEKRSALEVVTELMFPPSDVIRFAEQSPSSASGSVPFERGLHLLEGAKKTLLAAACATLRPAKYHPRLSLADAALFLEQCRLGQTERGSFVLTVACPLDIAIKSELFRNQFTRHVTQSLMGSLRFLVHNLERGDTQAILNPERNSPILSSNLCDGLLEMAPREDDGWLGVTANYSRELATAEASAAVPQTVRFTSNMFAKIEKLSSDLKPAAEVTTATRLVGFVETLDGRPNEDKRVEGKVMLRLITPDETIRVRADLDVTQYTVADQAHMAAAPVSVTGNLQGSGRSYQMENISLFTLAQSN